MNMYGGAQMKRRAAACLPVFFFVAAGVATTGCDHGLHYRPTNWSRGPDRRWSTSVNDVDVETTGIGGLSGASDLSVEFTIHNRSQSPVTLAGGDLRTGAGNFPSAPAPDPGR